MAERRALGVPLAPVAPEPPSSSRRWIVGVAAAVVVLGFGGTAALLLSRGSEAQPEASSAPPAVAAPAGASEPPREAAPIPSEVAVPSEVAREEAADVANPWEEGAVPTDSTAEAPTDSAPEPTRSPRLERRREREAAPTEAPSAMDEATTMDLAEPAMVEASVMQPDPPRMDPPRMVAPQDEPIFNPYRQ